MPTYRFTGPDGRVLKVTGATPPSEAELDAMFAQSAEPAAPERTWTDTAVDALPTIGGTIGGIVGGIGGTAFGVGIGGVPGAVGGAALGGATGESARQLVNRMRGKDDAPATPLDAASGIATQGAIQGSAELVGQGVVKGATAVGRGLYRGYLKPSLAKASIGKSERIVETSLREGLPITKSGVNKAARITSDLRSQVDNLLRQGDAAGETVDLHVVANKIRRFAEKKYFQPGRPSADYDAAMKIADSLDLHPSLNGNTVVSLSRANEIKRGIWDSLGENSFGVERDATKTTQKVAGSQLRKFVERGAKAAGLEDVGPLNAREGSLLEAARTLTRAVGREGNKNQVTGWTPLIAAGLVGGTEWGRTGDPYMAMVKAIGTRVALDPAVMSRAAIVAYRLGQTSGAAPAVVARLAIQAASEPDAGE